MSVLSGFTALDNPWSIFNIFLFCFIENIDYM
jgi:hypothetical protein